MPVLSWRPSGLRKTIRAPNSLDFRREWELDIVKNIKISFIESIIASIKESEYHISLNSHDCNGTGAWNERVSIIACDIRNGAGVTVVQKRTPLGVKQFQNTCTDCHGTREVITKKCSGCDSLNWQKHLPKVHLKK